MSAETETTIARMAQVTNIQVAGELHTPAVRLLRFHERQERQEEMAQLEQHLAAPPWAASAMTPEGRRELSKRKIALKKDLEQNSPRDDLSGETIDALVRRQRVLESYIREGMLTREEMRRNPPGAVDQHKHWNSKKSAVLEWKNNQVQLHPQSDDIDLCNIERLRPSEVSSGRAATFMLDAQIPGNFAMTPQAKDNWPLGAPTVRTATSHLPNFDELVATGPAPGMCYVCGRPTLSMAKICRECLQEALEGDQGMKKMAQRVPCKRCGRPFAKNGISTTCSTCKREMRTEQARRMRATRQAKKEAAQAEGALP